MLLISATTECFVFISTQLSSPLKFYSVTQVFCHDSDIIISFRIISMFVFFLVFQSRNLSAHRNEYCLNYALRMQFWQLLYLSPMNTDKIHDRIQYPCPVSCIDIEISLLKKLKRNYCCFLYNLQPTSLPIETLMSSHNSNLPISENTENDTQLTQLDHPDSIDGKFSISYFYFSTLKKTK